MKKRYLLVKDVYSNETVFVKYDENCGFKMKPLNNVKYDGVIVDSIIIVKPSLIEKLLKRKTKRKLEMYLMYVRNLLDSDDDSDDSYRIALDDLERYKYRIINAYGGYLDNKYIRLLFKKIDLLEHELKMKLIEVKFKQSKNDVFESRRSR